MPFDVWGGEQKRDYNYVDDVVEALLVAALDPASDGMIYNIGSDEILSLRESAEIICDAWPGATFDVKEFPADRKKIDIGDYYSDYGLFNAHTGWRPAVPFRTGVEKSLAYCAENLSFYI